MWLEYFSFDIAEKENPTDNKERKTRDSWTNIESWEPNWFSGQHALGSVTGAGSKTVVSQTGFTKEATFREGMVTRVSLLWLALLFTDIEEKDGFGFLGFVGHVGFSYYGVGSKIRIIRGRQQPPERNMWHLSACLYTRHFPYRTQLIFPLF